MDTSPPTLEAWLSWPTPQVAEEVKRLNPSLTMGWAMNGTRRWYFVQRRRDPRIDDYLTCLIRRQAELHRMVYSHGIRYLLAPGLGKDNLRGGPAYIRSMIRGIPRLGEDEGYRSLFRDGLCVRFYGDFERVFREANEEGALQACRTLMEETAENESCYLLFGLFADDAYDGIARLTCELADRLGRPPGRAELIRAYYGIDVPDLGFFLTSDTPMLFDVPLVTTGAENLYATVGPSPDLSQAQFRAILYDHLFLRCWPHIDYDNLPPDSQVYLEAQVQAGRGKTLGAGEVDPHTGLWHWPG